MDNRGTNRRAKVPCVVKPDLTLIRALIDPATENLLVYTRETKIEIIRTTPSSIKVKVGDRVAKLTGESFARAYGSPDFIIDATSVTHWEPPFDSIEVSAIEKSQIIEFVLSQLRGRGWDIKSE